MVNEVRENNSNSERQLSVTWIGLASFAVLLAATILVYKDDHQKPKLTLVDPEIGLLPSPSVLKRFAKAAISSDSVPCSNIGRNILKRNGSAVDGAIAVLLCNGIVNMEAMGIGGGVIMTIYKHDERKAYSIVARESAPSAASADMFYGQLADDLSSAPWRTGSVRGTRRLIIRFRIGSPITFVHPGTLRATWSQMLWTLRMPKWAKVLGQPMKNLRMSRLVFLPPHLPNNSGLSVGVPGELKGYWEAWKKFGRLPWFDLVEPSVNLCRSGYQMSKPQREALQFRPGVIEGDLNLRSWFISGDTGQLKRWGSTIVPSKLCNTYEIIAKEGGLALHDGSLTRIFVEDVKQLGGILSVEDMNNYRVDWSTPLSIQIGQDVLYSAPPPASGALLAHILHIQSGYNLTPKDLSSSNDTVRTIHRVIESFKFAFAHRGLLGDPHYVNVSWLMDKLMSAKYGDEVRAKIDDKTYSEPRHYSAVSSKLNNFGTNHVSVLSSDGDAVAATSTINLYFGAGVTSKRTGIVLNNVMDDFSIENTTNYFDLPPSLHNSIEPGKKPVSSACPTIIVSDDGRVKLVIGASGGTRIVTSIAWVISRMIWFGENLKAAIDASRIHHQLSPNVLNYEYGLVKDVISGLKSRGHRMERSMTRSVICGISVVDGSIYTNADYRKFGGAVGLN